MSLSPCWSLVQFRSSRVSAASGQVVPSVAGS